MNKLEDYYGAPIKSGFYKSSHNFENICYLDLENLKIIRMDNKEISMDSSLCKMFIPIQDPLKLAENYRKIACFIASEFITSKLEKTTQNIQNNKANLNAHETLTPFEANLNTYAKLEQEFGVQG